MVFQNYALYPNKTVYKNLAFPLQMRKLPKPEIDKKVMAAAKVLDIVHLLERRPRELSGGQQQRVALGRALVRDPRGLPDGRAALQSRRQAARADALASSSASTRTSTPP